MNGFRPHSWMQVTVAEQVSHTYRLDGFSEQLFICSSRRKTSILHASLSSHGEGRNF